MASPRHPPPDADLLCDRPAEIFPVGAALVAPSGRNCVPCHVDAVRDGLQRYARIHPCLEDIWQEDLAAMEDLAAEREEAEGNAPS